MTTFLIFYFSFNLGAVIADLIVHNRAKDNPHPADIILELLFACPVMLFYFVIEMFD